MEYNTPSKTKICIFANPIFALDRVVINNSNSSSPNIKGKQNKAIKFSTLKGAAFIKVLSVIEGAKNAHCPCMYYWL